MTVKPLGPERLIVILGLLTKCLVGHQQFTLEFIIFPPFFRSSQKEKLPLSQQYYDSNRLYKQVKQGVL